ncbi:MAG: hypothetical protein HC819_10445 [Cyclobacteriaceae bacterium]|nr:hypothetical protein [Cyclobacteriaceae bacterium]
MKRKLPVYFIFANSFLVSIAYAQVGDSVVVRDFIGDMNESAIRRGEFPGAIRIPGSNVSLAIGGFIKAVAFYDTKYNVKNEIILPGTFNDNDMLKGQTYIGARSSRLFFDGRSNLDNIQIRGYFEMDFRGNSGFTLRHAYLQLTNTTKQSILMGQYWSLVLDLQTVPEGLVEPTVSGSGFARHGQIRFTTPISQSLKFAVAAEEPNNSDLQGVDIESVNKYPDLVTSFYYDAKMLHFSLTGMYRPMTFVYQSDQSVNSEPGLLLSAGAVIKPGSSDKITLGALIGSGASNYIMGADGIAGYITSTSRDLQNQRGGFGTYRHRWNEKFRSNIALGYFEGDEIDNFSNPHLKSSTYGFINTYYTLNKYVNIGVEWIYSQKERYNAERLANNRFQFGIQIF